jgi:hypothetical protein
VVALAFGMRWLQHRFGAGGVFIYSPALRAGESAVAAALCRRSPRPGGNANRPREREASWSPPALWRFWEGVMVKKASNGARVCDPQQLRQTEGFRGFLGVA